MIIPLIILICAAILFIQGRIRSDIVALMALVALIITRSLTVDEALSGFASPVVIMMIGLFIVSGAIFRTGLANVIGSQLIKVGGKNENMLFFILMSVTALLGAFISVLGTVALMIPIVVSICRSRNLNPRRYLIPLSYAGLMGGMLTLIGTPPNLVIQDVLSDGGIDLKFFDFFPLGMACVLIGVVIMIPASKYMFGDKHEDSDKKKKESKTLAELSREYGLTNNLYRVRIPEKSSIVGNTVMDLDVRKKFHVHILEIRRGDNDKHRFLKTISQEFVNPDTRLEEDDLLYVRGDIENVKEFADTLNLTLMDSHETEEAAKSSLDFYDIGIAEIVLMPGSDLVGHTVKEVDFRDRYNVNVLGIQRKKQYLLSDLGNAKVKMGDVLLVQGRWHDIATLSRDDTNWVVAGQPLSEREKVTLDYKAPVAALIMVMMVALMLFIEPVTAVMTAALLMILSGCFRSVEAAYRTINWEAVFLIAAFMPLSLALEKSGVSDLMSQTLVDTLRPYGPYALMAGIYITTGIVTNFMSNTAIAIIMAPIAMSSASQMGCSPTPFLFAVTYGASMCFIFPFSTPSNAMVQGIGRYTTSDYVRIGLPMQIAMGLIMIFIIPLFFPF